MKSLITIIIFMLCIWYATLHVLHYTYTVSECWRMCERDANWASSDDIGVSKSMVQHAGGYMDIS